MENEDINLDDFEVRTYQIFKFGDLVRDVYRYPDNLFEIGDFEIVYYKRIIDLDTFKKLLKGEMNIQELYDSNVHSSE